jgi:hypothetical protein
MLDNRFTLLLVLDAFPWRALAQQAAMQQLRASTAALQLAAPQSPQLV